MNATNQLGITALAGCIAFSLAMSLLQAQEIRAKELYYSVLTGAPSGVSESNPDSVARNRRALQAGAPSTIAGIGLKAWIERRGPSGSWTRVRTDAAFHSGERIAIHVEANTGGRLTILQQQDAGPPEVVFPDSRIRNGDDRIRAEMDTSIGFVFDDSPGKITLFLLLKPGAAAQERPAALPPADLLKTAETLSRSKGLKIDIDESSEPALFGAAPVSAQGARAGFAMKISLDHKPRSIQ